MFRASFATLPHAKQLICTNSVLGHILAEDIARKTVLLK
jgi:hypothetical protein